MTMLKKMFLSLLGCAMLAGCATEKNVTAMGGLSQPPRWGQIKGMISDQKDMTTYVTNTTYVVVTNVSVIKTTNDDVVVNDVLFTTNGTASDVTTNETLISCVTNSVGPNVIVGVAGIGGVYGTAVTYRVTQTGTRMDYFEWRNANPPNQDVSIDFYNNTNLIITIPAGADLASGAYGSIYNPRVRNGGGASVGNQILSVYTLSFVTNYTTVTNSMTNIVLQLNDKQVGGIVTNTLYPNNTNLVNIGTSTNPFNSGYFATSVQIGTNVITPNKIRIYDALVVNVTNNLIPPDNFTIRRNNNKLSVDAWYANNIALAMFKISTLGSYGIFNMVDGIVDRFADQLGVDFSVSTNLVYDSTNFWYQNPYVYSTTEVVTNGGGGTVTNTGFAALKNSDSSTQIFRANITPDFSLQEFTVNEWFWLPTTNSFQDILDQQNTLGLWMGTGDGDEGNFIAVAVVLNSGDAAGNQGNMLVQIRPSGGDNFVVPYESITSNKWYMLTIRREGSTVEVWLDGQKAAGGIGSGTATTIRKITAGVWGWGNVHNGKLAIDEFSIWTNAIDTNYIATLYNNGYGLKGTITNAPYNVGLWAGYNFDENTGTNLTDYSGNDIPANIGDPAMTWVTGITNIVTSGGTPVTPYDVYFPYPNMPEFGLPYLPVITQQSVSMWCKFDDPNTHVMMMAISAPDTCLVAKRDIGQGNRVDFLYYGGGQQVNLNGTGMSYGTNWHHFVFVTDSTVSTGLYIYVDGVNLGGGYEFGFNGTPLNFTGSGVTNLRIGACAGWVPSTAGLTLDEVGVWDRVLTEGEITNLYDEGKGLYGDITKSPHNDHLITAYHFDEGSGTTALNYSSQGTAANAQNINAYYPTYNAGEVAIGSSGGGGSVVTNTVWHTNGTDIVSTNFNTAFIPSNSRMILYMDNNAVVTNTEIMAYASRDNGTTWNQCELFNDGIYDLSNFVFSGIVSLTNQPAGTNMRWRVQGTNTSWKLIGVSESWGE